MEFVVGTAAVLAGLAIGWLVRTFVGPNARDVDAMRDRVQVAERRRDTLSDELAAEGDVVAVLRQALHDEQRLLNRVAESEGVEPERFRASLAAIYQAPAPSHRSDGLERRICFDPDGPVADDFSFRRGSGPSGPPLVRYSSTSDDLGSSNGRSEPDRDRTSISSERAAVDRLHAELADRDRQLAAARSEIKTIRSEVEALALVSPPPAIARDESDRGGDGDGIILDLRWEEPVIDLTGAAEEQRAERVAVTTAELRFLQERLAASRVLEEELVGLREKIAALSLENDALTRAAGDREPAGVAARGVEIESLSRELKAVAERLVVLGERLGSSAATPATGE